MKLNNCLSFLTLVILILFSSCAQKIHLQEADKIKSDTDVILQENIKIDSYFAGDALEYLIFEVDIFNNTEDTIVLNNRNIQLVIEEKDGTKVILDPLNKKKVISDLNQYHIDIKNEKKTRDISNAIGIGINLLFIGASSANVGFDVALFTLDSASYLLEDSRAHKLLSGSIEEQIAYVNEWVLEKDTIPPGGDNSWDILFPRNLQEAFAQMVSQVNGLEFRQTYILHIREEKVR